MILSVIYSISRLLERVLWSKHIQKKIKLKNIKKIWLFLVKNIISIGDIYRWYISGDIYHTNPADDITCSTPISSSADSKVSASINWGLDWCIQNSMHLNIDKTKAMQITLGHNSKASTLQSIPVNLVENWKFLGIIVDKHLVFKLHMDYITSKATRRFYGLLQLKRLGVAVDKLCLFYTANIRSILTYCIPSFYGFLCKFQLDRLERVQRLSTKIMLPI